MVNKYIITELQRTLVEQVVSTVGYKLESTDDNGKVYVWEGSITLTGSASDPGFIAFESLTEADALAWVYSKIDKPTIEEYTIRMKNQFDNKPTNLPWK